MATASTQSGSTAFGQESQQQCHAQPYLYQPSVHFNQGLQQRAYPPSQRYAHQQTTTTASSSASTTPSTTSPTSPPHLLPSQSNTSISTAATSAGSTHPAHFNIQSKQLRPPRVPAYVPAALRPTEHHAFPSKPKNGHKRGQSTSAATTSSATGSLDGHETADEGDAARASYLRSRRGSWIGDLPSKIARIVTDEWNIDDGRMEDVTGLPTRDHWKPDTSTPKCELPSCPTHFTLLTRRHHCRRCGSIFCASHSTSAVPLDQMARFHPKGRLARACDPCFGDWGMWRRERRAGRGGRAGAEQKERRKRGLGGEEGVEEGGEEGEGSGSSGSVTPVPAEGHKGDKGAKGMVVGSVPRDWSWSTF